jgi:hypothetical protein
MRQATDLASQQRLEEERFANQERMAQQRQAALAQQSLAIEATQRLSSSQEELYDRGNEMSQLAQLAEEGQQKARDMEHDKLVMVGPCSLTLSSPS